MNRNIQRKILAGLLAAGIAIPVGLNPSAVLAADERQFSEKEQTLLQIFEILREGHWYNIGEEALFRGAVNGMLHVLNDPYTDYFSSEEYHQFIDTINQNYAGVGIRLGQNANRILVEEVFANSPAEAAGLKKGDLILEVDGKSAIDKPISEVGTWFRGKEGTSVSVTFERPGNAPQTITITRQAIRLPVVTSKLLDEETGYIRIMSFSETLDKEFDLALADLQRKGIRSLVLDVRGNSGGIMGTALHIADRFLKGGNILQVKTRTGEKWFRADVEGVDMPLAILIDGDSASASEMLAGALQANKRAKLIGQQSFGKGIIQGSEELLNGDILKYTVAQYYFTNGSSPHEVGVKPDVSVKTVDLQLPAALHVLHPERGRTIEFDLKNGKTIVNGQELTNQRTFFKEGVRYLPLRFTLEALGSEVVWNPQDFSISFTYEGRNVTLMTQTGEMKIDGQRVENLNHPLLIEQGVSYWSMEALRAAVKPDVLFSGEDRIEISEK